MLKIFSLKIIFVQTKHLTEFAVNYEKPTKKIDLLTFNFHDIFNLTSVVWSYKIWLLFLNILSQSKLFTNNAKLKITLEKHHKLQRWNAEMTIWRSRGLKPKNFNFSLEQKAWNVNFVIKFFRTRRREIDILKRVNNIHWILHIKCKK